MEHKESSLQINFTNEYARFRMINGNRQLNEGKIKKIIKEITSGNDMLKYYPIQVRENGDRLDILDGQHRFFICRKLKRPVFYILVAEERSMPEIAKVNSNVEKWKSTDFINCYVANNNGNYKIIQKLQDEYKVGLTVLLKMLESGNPGAEGSHPNTMEDFRNGEFVVMHQSETVELIECCKEFSPFSAWKSRAFIIAIHRIRKAGLVPLSDLVSAYKKRPEFLTEQANYKSYVSILEQMLNVGKQKRIVIL